MKKFLARALVVGAVTAMAVPAFACEGMSPKQTTASNEKAEKKTVAKTEKAQKKADGKTAQSTSVVAQK